MGQILHGSAKINLTGPMAGHFAEGGGILR
jgi:hypothetical protein